MMHPTPTFQRGFTLIEMSVVLVIIGLIVGGIFVGQSLIAAAGVRATITQIEKYNTAVNTFRAKYDCLPGDCANAANFGFPARGTLPGQGDGNGIIQGAGAAGWVGMGETGLFWVDLSQANLIDGSFNTAVASVTYATITGTTLDAWLPQAKLGQGNYIYVWSGGWQQVVGGVAGDGINYFGISASPTIYGTASAQLCSSSGLTVQQAFSIDTKIDDGLPQSGNVMAMFLNQGTNWAAGGGVQGAWQWGVNNDEAPTTTATPGSATTCYDNSSAASGTPGVGGAVQHYSVEISSGSNVNCALSFRFQ